MVRHFGTAPFLIAGPCVVESDDLNVQVGEALADLGTKLGMHVVYKASYDKANRSRLKGARGPGLEAGLRALERVRAATGLAILTDVHEPGHVPAAAHVADVLQIPAFLCRQTDLLIAVCSPRQIPKNGSLCSRAQRMASSIPSTPRTPNPPGTSRPSYGPSSSPAVSWSVKRSDPIQSICTPQSFAIPPCTRAS